MKLEHIGIAVKSIDEKLKLWKALGLSIGEIHELPLQKVKAVALDAGEVKIELVEPIGDDSPISKFIKKRGEGLHHLCFEVKNLESVIKALGEQGITTIEDLPHPGAFAKKVVFLHPKTTDGILIELCEK